MTGNFRSEVEVKVEVRLKLCLYVTQSRVARELCESKSRLTGSGEWVTGEG